MRKYQILVAILCTQLFWFSPSCAQRQLDKQEIFQAWIKSELQESNQKISSRQFIGYDSNMNDQLSRCIADIEYLSVDTFGFFVQALPGYIFRDTCMSAYYPSTIHVYWAKDGKVYSRKLTNNCTYPISTISSSILLDFYKANKICMRGEYIMPVILRATMTTEGRISQTHILSSHDPYYIIYCQMNQDSGYMEFSENAIMYKENIFYDDNRATNLFTWFSLVRKEIEGF